MYEVKFVTSHEVINTIPKKDERRVLPADAQLDLRKWRIEQEAKEKLPQLGINSDDGEGENEF